MSLIIDIIENAQLDHGIAGGTLVRIAYVSGLDIGFASGDPGMLFRALTQAGLPQWYDVAPASPGFNLLTTPYTLNRHVVEPLSDSTCRVTMYYVSGPAQPAASTWLVTESSTPMQVTTQIHPGSNDVMKIRYASADGKVKVPVQVATFAYDITIRRVQFEGWLAPSTNLQSSVNQYASLVNSVNGSAWRGLRPGFWRMNEFSDSTADRAASFTIRAGFITKVTEDWSQYQIIRDPNFGKIIKPDAADVSDMRTQNYQYTWLQGNGITKAGLYPMADFPSIFGN